MRPESPPRRGRRRRRAVHAEEELEEPSISIMEGRHRRGTALVPAPGIFGTFRNFAVQGDPGNGAGVAKAGCCQFWQAITPAAVAGEAFAADATP